MKRAYTRYRDSGVEWLGDVPAHWRVSRLERVASYSTSNVDKKTEDHELPVRLCNYTDVYYQDRIRAGSGEYMQATASLHEIARFQLRVGDTLITKDSEDWKDIGVPALVEQTASDFLCGYHLGIIHPNPELHADFLFRAMQTASVNRQLQVSASGVTRFGLPNAAVGEALLPLPPLAEQHAIATFLDGETVRIDKLVEKNRILIERLAEYRTAMITRAVTRGLDPSAPLKPSGVKWLGDIPAHWDVAQLCRRLDIVNGGTPSGSNEDYWDGEVTWLTPDDLGRSVTALIAEGARKITQEGVSDSSARISPSGSIVMSTRAPIGHLAVTATPAATNQGCRTLVPKAGIDNWYAYYVLLAGRECVQALGKGSTFMELSLTDLRHHLIPLPPIEEQRGISDHLDRETERIDALISKAAATVERLREYRAALITAAVTGKIDVREPEQAP